MNIIEIQFFENCCGFFVDSTLRVEYVYSSPLETLISTRGKQFEQRLKLCSPLCQHLICVVGHLRTKLQLDGPYQNTL